MALASGALMEVADYDNLALEVNRLYSDINPNRTYEAVYDPISNLITNAATCNAIFSQSAALNLGHIAGTVLTLTEPYVGYGDPAVAGDLIVVVINSVTMIENTDWTINYTANTVTILGTIAAAVNVAIYNRTEHAYGWGQASSVYPHPVFPASNKGTSSVLEANVNNLVDKVNIMSTRVGNITSLSRVAQEALIYYSDKTTIQTQIDTNILPAPNYWANTIATINTSALTMTQTTLWTSLLSGTFGWTFANYQAARYFFNAGNQLRCEVLMTGAANDPGYLNWNQVVTQLGTVIIDRNTTSQTGAGGTSNNIGFYELTDVFQPIFTGNAPLAPYSGDATSTPVLTAASNFANMHAVLEARYTTANGNHSVEVKLTMDDVMYAQDIAGTTTFTAGHKVSNALINNSANYGIATPIILGVSSLSNTFVPGSTFIAAISTNQQELNLAVWALANGWNGTAAVEITVAPGVYIWSDNTTIAGLTTGIFPGGLTLTNNGYIIGKGGAGAEYANGDQGQHGGPAFSIGTTTMTLITGTGYVAGGGGGGGSGPTPVDDNAHGGGGGGAGGGRGGAGQLLGGNKRISAGGAGGTIGLYGVTGVVGNLGSPGGAGGSGGGTAGNFNHDAKNSDGRSGGGGGGRILPSTTGPINNNGGAGGGPEIAGGAGNISSGGGGWGAPGGTPPGSSGVTAGSIGGAAGNAITKNGNVLAVIGSQTLIYGAIA